MAEGGDAAPWDFGVPGLEFRGKAGNLLTEGDELEEDRVAEHPVAGKKRFGPWVGTKDKKLVRGIEHFAEARAFMPHR